MCLHCEAKYQHRCDGLSVSGIYVYIISREEKTFQHLENARCHGHAMWPMMHICTHVAADHDEVPVLVNVLPVLSQCNALLVSNTLAKRIGEWPALKDHTQTLSCFRAPRHPRLCMHTCRHARTHVHTIIHTCKCPYTQVPVRTRIIITPITAQHSTAPHIRKHTGLTSYARS